MNFSNFYKHWSLAVGSLLLFSSVISADVPDTINGTTLITAEELIELVDKYDNLVIIDARIDKDRTGGYIEGAVILPDIDTTADSLDEVIPDKATPVIFYCNGVKCGRSVKSSRIAVEAGYTHIYWFKGGWEEWINKGMPIAK